MIGRISGTVIAKNPPDILVDVQGVGYEVAVPMSTFCNLPELGQAVTLFTHFVVREDAQLLFGFLSLEERRTFRQLIRVSGIGPKIALAILSGLPITELIAQIENGEASSLTRIPGIGKKTAERLVLELKGKLHAEGYTALLTPQNAAQADIVSALIALGYSEREAQKALKGLPETLSVSEGIRLALKSLT